MIQLLFQRPRVVFKERADRPTSIEAIKILHKFAATKNNLTRNRQKNLSLNDISSNLFFESTAETKLQTLGRKKGCNQYDKSNFKKPTIEKCLFRRNFASSKNLEKKIARRDTGIISDDGERKLELRLERPRKKRKYKAFAKTSQSSWRNARFFLGAKTLTQNTDCSAETSSSLKLLYTTLRISGQLMLLIWTSYPYTTVVLTVFFCYWRFLRKNESGTHTLDVGWRNCNKRFLERSQKRKHSKFGPTTELNSVVLSNVFAFVRIQRRFQIIVKKQKLGINGHISNNAIWYQSHTQYTTISRVNRFTGLAPNGVMKRNVVKVFCFITSWTARLETDHKVTPAKKTLPIQKRHKKINDELLRFTKVGTFSLPKYAMTHENAEDLQGMFHEPELIRVL